MGCRGDLYSVMTTFLYRHPSLRVSVHANALLFTSGSSTFKESILLRFYKDSILHRYIAPILLCCLSGRRTFLPVQSF